MSELYTPHIYTLRDILGEVISREEALTRIQNDREAFSLFEPLPDAAKDKLLSFIQGSCGLSMLKSNQ